jgi:hypothetical protein
VSFTGVDEMVEAFDGSVRQRCDPFVTWRGQVSPAVNLSAAFSEGK